jgi:hypothetical protein
MVEIGPKELATWVVLSGFAKTLDRNKSKITCFSPALQQISRVAICAEMALYDKLETL